MANMTPNKTPMPTREPNVRNSDFLEVATGYTVQMAMDEASRCLNCKNPLCVSGCPVNVNIPAFISKVASGEFEEAYKIIKNSNGLPAICGRVCPQENQCEGKCVRGIKNEPVGIGRLERFVADTCADKENSIKIENNGIKVAVVGSGPSGLSCAGDLAKLGYDVTVFEAFHEPGGVLIYGIPEFRLPKKIVKREIDGLKKLGVKIVCDVVIGRTLLIDDLYEQGFKAVFIGSGAGLPRFMNIEGETSIGVLSANEFLTRINLMKAWKDDYDTPIQKSENVVVVGGGNVAMDAARCAKRLGAHVSIVYRRSEQELPARREEVLHAKEEGIDFNLLCNPCRIIQDEQGKACKVECVKMELGEPDESGRRSPVEIKDSNFFIDADTVIIAIGTSPNPLIRQTTPDIECNKRGCLIVDEKLATTKKSVYAGGDAVTGAATVILAMGAGKNAAKSIDEYIKSNI